ncbi:MAG: class I tRNA ligase family protein [Planctomycetota bacterium]|nr:class I tRNA ligase family protein [Planctomycetota bacterium]
MTRYLVTSALPYANGPIHFGHIAGAYLPADVYVRYLKAAKGSENVLYVCGTDEHGVAITMKAEAEGSDYRPYVDKWHHEIKSLFDNFDINFDIF